MNWTAIGVIVAIVATVCLPVLAGAAAMLWKSSAMVTQMSAALGEMRATITEMRLAMQDLNKIPLHEQRLTQLEDTVNHHGKTLLRHEQRLGHHSGTLGAVRAGSSPELGKVK